VEVCDGTERGLVSTEIRMSSTGIATGLKKGFPVEKRITPKRPSQNKRVRHCRLLFDRLIGFYFRD
jgi:hypothetical protein